MAKNVLAVGAALAVVSGLVVGGPALADQGGRRGHRNGQHIVLSGAHEVPKNPHGNADRGSVRLRLGPDQVCFRLGRLHLTAGEPLPNNAHIHRAPVGVAGPVVVPLFNAATAPTSYPTEARCVSVATALMTEIRQNPREFYVNLHNTTHPPGVVRGQLHR